MATVQGPDEVGNVASKVLAASARLFLRCAAGGLILGTQAVTAMANADATLTSAELLTGIVSMTPASSGKTLTLPTATLLVRNIPGCEAGDSIDVKFMNLAASDLLLTIAEGTGGSIVGRTTVEAAGVVSELNAGAGTYRIRITDVATPTYIAYRIE